MINIRLQTEITLKLTNSKISDNAMGCCKSRDGFFRKKTDEELLNVPEEYKEAFKNNDVKELTKMFTE